MELLAPEAPIGMEHHQHSTLGLHQPGRQQGHELQEAAEVGEAAQGEAERRQQLLVAALFAAEAVEQLTQGGRGAQARLGRHAAHRAAAEAPAR
jgi:multidrug resistance efflux pump